MATRRDFLALTGAASLWSTGGVFGPGTADALARTLADGIDEGNGEYLLTPGLAYLNTGSTGPSTKTVLERTIAAWRQLETNPVREAYGPGVQLDAETVRAQAAAFLGCGADELLITRSTSEAMNTVAQSMRLNTGDRVLSTDQEHEGGT